MRFNKTRGSILELCLGMRPSYEVLFYRKAENSNNFAESPSSGLPLSLSLFLCFFSWFQTFVTTCGVFTSIDQGTFDLAVLVPNPSLLSLVPSVFNFMQCNLLVAGSRVRHCMAAFPGDRRQFHIQKYNTFLHCNLSSLHTENTALRTRHRIPCQINKCS